MPFSGGSSGSGGGSADAVLYTEQSLSEAQKLIAQANILSYNWSEGKSMEYHSSEYPGYPGYPLEYQKFKSYDGETPNANAYEVTIAMSDSGFGAPVRKTQYWTDKTQSTKYARFQERLDPYATFYTWELRDQQNYPGDISLVTEYHTAYNWGLTYNYANIRIARFDAGSTYGGFRHYYQSDLGTTVQNLTETGLNLDQSYNGGFYTTTFQVGYSDDDGTSRSRLVLYDDIGYDTTVYFNPMQMFLAIQDHNEGLIYKFYSNVNEASMSMTAYNLDSYGGIAEVTPNRGSFGYNGPGSTFIGFKAQENGPRVIGVLEHNGETNSDMTTMLPDDKTWGIYRNLTNQNIFLIYNDNNVIKKVQLT